MKRVLTLMTLLLPAVVLSQAWGDFEAVRAEVDFSNVLREWDGFGFNYVEVPQTMDYKKDAQEYGGFSLLTENERQEIVDLIFGDEGLKPGIVKMFFDPWQQKEAGGPSDHETTTRWMRYFVREGLKKTRERGDDFQIITTLYGPPPWATKQKFLRGRDLDPDQKYNLAEYIINWVDFLKNTEKFPVKWISLHNEGEDWQRWPADGQSGNIGHGHDYNMFWPPEQVVDFLKFMRPMLDARNLHCVGLTPGECTNWYRFSYWGYADAITNDEGALNNLGMVVSHGFYGGGYGRWFGEHRSVGIDRIREKRPDMHAWVTSTSWSKMDADNIKEHHGNIYTAKVNGIIPWAGIQRPAKWVGGDPNPGCAVNIDEDGNYEVRRGYYYYKQVSRAGQPGMGVAQTMAMDSEVAVIGFARSGTDNPDAFVVVNLGKNNKKTGIKVRGGSSKLYQGFRTSDEKDRYKSLGEFSLDAQDILWVTMPARSATTFFAK